MKATCGGCPTVWFGHSIAHCPTCHETFSTVGHFDAHRFRGNCRDPAGLTAGPKGQDTGEPLLKRNRTGVWVGARTRPEELNQ